GDAVIGLRVLVIARDHRQAPGQPLENLLADLLAGVFDGLARVVPEGRVRPLVAGYADNRTLKLPAALHAVKRPGGLLFRQIPGNAEDHQDVCGRGRRYGHVSPPTVALIERRALFHGRTNRSTALAKPSSSLDVVTRRAARWTSGLALPMAMLSPEWANMSTSLGWSPIVASSAAEIP